MKRCRHASYALSATVESQDIEASSVNVVYDCNNPATTTGSGAIGQTTATWNAQIATLHVAADNAELKSNGELYAHSLSNPEYLPIWSAIPLEGAPLISGINPPSDAPGKSGNLSIYGQNLDASPVVNVACSGFTNSVSYVSSSQINASYGIASNAPVGSCTISVTTDNGTSNGAAFMIVAGPPPAPSISGISPTSGARGTSGFISIYGQNLVNGTPVVSVSGTGVTVTNSYVSAGQINVAYTIASSAATGTRTLTVATTSGTSNSASFAVQ